MGRIRRRSGKTTEIPEKGRDIKLVARFRLGCRGQEMPCVQTGRESDLGLNM